MSWPRCSGSGAGHFIQGEGCSGEGLDDAVGPFQLGVGSKWQVTLPPPMLCFFGPVASPPHKVSHSLRKRQACIYCKVIASEQQAATGSTQAAVRNKKNSVAWEEWGGEEGDTATVMCAVCTGHPQCLRPTLCETFLAFRQAVFSCPASLLYLRAVHGEAPSFCVTAHASVQLEADV